jgi:hypothetical protein
MNGKIASKLLRILPLTVGVLLGIEIVCINLHVTSGRTLFAIDSMIGSLEKENNLLEQRVASASSLIAIEVKAKEIGFREPTKSQYLTIVPDELPMALMNPQ